VGPAAMVAAAFIGPGTVTTATIAGSSYGYTLLWAVLFSVLATLVLQEMAARLGTSTQHGFGQALRVKITHSVIRALLALLVIAAIFVGNAAYEAGNITGAAMGLDYDPHKWPFNPWIVVIGLTAGIILWSGKYKLIEGALVLMVASMGTIFLLLALYLKPSLSALAAGMFLPVIPNDALVMVVSLIGTTVVPYNLFLHATAASKKWDRDDLASARLDTLISVVGGGLITMSILITSAIAFEGSPREVKNMSDLSFQLEPLMGAWSGWFMSAGFFAAGLSSAITAPLAASWATSEVLGWEGSLRSASFRLVWMFVLLTGLFFASLELAPTRVILFAQFANGLLLPVLALMLLWIMNDRNILGDQVNNFKSNVPAVIVILITLILGLKSIASVLGVLDLGYFS
jgi:NRAMP (natural resistance-associated macrophage protein)-like metal ion transporter